MDSDHIPLEVQIIGGEGRRRGRGAKGWRAGRGVWSAEENESFRIGFGKTTGAGNINEEWKERVKNVRRVGGNGVRRGNNRKMGGGMKNV